jgi:RNA polymerase sigma factor (sigma-70 family)
VTVQRPVEGRPSEDAGLVRRARDGDTSAFDELVMRHRDVAFRVAWLVTRNSHEAEDATQEAFVKAYYALPRFRSESPFRPWILRIVANEAKNRGRSSRRREALAVRAAARAGPAEDVPSPEAEALASEDREVVLAAVERLGEADRLVIAYRFFQLSEREMAEILGVRPGTVKSRLSRALTRLRAELPAGSDDG